MPYHDGCELHSISHSWWTTSESLTELSLCTNVGDRFDGAGYVRERERETLVWETRCTCLRFFCSKFLTKTIIISRYIERYRLKTIKISMILCRYLYYSYMHMYTYTLWRYDTKNNQHSRGIFDSFETSTMCVVSHLDTVYYLLINSVGRDPWKTPTTLHAKTTGWRAKNPPSMAKSQATVKFRTPSLSLDRTCASCRKNVSN